MIEKMVRKQVTSSNFILFSCFISYHWTGSLGVVFSHPTVHGQCDSVQSVQISSSMASFKNDKNHFFRYNLFYNL